MIRRVLWMQVAMIAVVAAMLITASGPLTTHFFASLYWTGMLLAAIGSIITATLLATGGSHGDSTEEEVPTQHQDTLPDPR
jgi:hypothetical protein